MLDMLKAIKLLKCIDDVKREAYYPTECMQPVLDSADISEEEVIKLLKICIQQGWLQVKEADLNLIKPGYLAALPAIISPEGYQALELYPVDGEL